MFVSIKETDIIIHESMKKRMKRPNYNVEVIKRLQEKYGVTPQFIRMSLSGDRVSETSTKIKADYKLMQVEQEKVLKSL